MADTDWWTTFEKTGCVTDYLSYKGIYAGENQNVQTAGNVMGEKKVESADNRDRDDTVRVTHR